MTLAIPHTAQLRQSMIRLMVNGFGLQTNDHPSGIKFLNPFWLLTGNKTEFLTRQNTPSRLGITGYIWFGCRKQQSVLVKPAISILAEIIKPNLI